MLSPTSLRSLWGMDRGCGVVMASNFPPKTLEVPGGRVLSYCTVTLHPEFEE